MIKDNFYIEKIDNKLAINLAIQYHYLHRRPPIVVAYGLFQKETTALVGFVIYGIPASPTVSRTLFGEENKSNIYELSRLWINDSVPKNGESFLIGNTIKLLDREIVVSFSDSSYNHLGVIYQATNFYYVGISAEGSEAVSSSGNKSSYLDVAVHREKFGEDSIQYKKRSKKHRYIFLNCNRKRKNELLSKLTLKIQPYPKDNSQNLIYGLKDPVSQQIRYVGKSTTGLRRPNQHKTQHSLTINNHKNNWIKSLLNKGKCYEIVVLEADILQEKLNEQECFWINHYVTLGHKLTNLTKGGDGTYGYKQKAESKAKMSEKRKKWYQDNELTEAMLQKCYKRKEHLRFEGVEYRECSDCTFQPIDCFYTDRSRYDGLCTICKDCLVERKREFRNNNPYNKLSDDDFKLSYKTRREAMAKGVKSFFDNNPAAKENLSRKRSKPVLRTDPETNEIKEYSSALSAKADGFNNTYISISIKSGKLYKGFKWRFKS